MTDQEVPDRDDDPLVTRNQKRFTDTVINSPTPDRQDLSDGDITLAGSSEAAIEKGAARGEDPPA